MIITKKCIPRRTVLRGMGAALALPLLDGMVPALAALRNTAAAPIRRFGVVYVPNGIIMDKWTPAETGAAFELSPILQPLAPFRDRVLVLSGLDNRPAEPNPGENSGPHARGPSTFLTGVHLKQTEGADIEAGTSLDQMVAREFGQHTQLASLELGVDASDVVGACDSGYSCAYLNTIVWRTPTTPLPMEHNPRAVFERLFGGTDSTDPRARQARIRQDRSLLDEVTRDVADLRRGLGARDRAKLTEYLEAVRDVERRIQKAEEQSTKDLPAVDQPAGIPATFEEHAKLMFDLQVLAYQCDLTRVITFMIRESTERAYPEIGIRDGHHTLTHHGGDPEKLAKVVKINTYHVSTFAYYLEKLRATPDGDGTLLDNVMIMYGAGLSDGNRHNAFNLPILLAGGGTGHIKGGRHVRFGETPLANLHLTVLDKMGIPAERVGDSTGELHELTGISSAV
jgi:hypothetical protein